MKRDLRRAKRSEWHSLTTLANRVFRPNGGDMIAEYPLLFGTANRRNLFVAVEGGEVVAHVGLCVRPVTLLGVALNAGSIGAVCTAPSARGMGLASSLMAMARKAALDQKCSLLFISGSRGLYRRLGYIDAGEFRSVHLPAGSLDTKLQLRPASSSDLPHLATLHRLEQVRFFRGDADWEALLAAGRLMNQPAEIWLVERGGVPVAYGAVQIPRPGSTELAVREIAGDRPSLLQALPELGLQYGMSSVETVVSARDSLVTLASGVPGSSMEPRGFEGTIGVINPVRCLDALSPLLKERSPTLSARMLLTATSSTEDITPLLFGGRDAGPHEAVPGLPIPCPWYGFNYV